MPSGAAPRVFVSYSHRDQEARGRLRVHLEPLLHNGLIEVWDDTMISPGDDWHAAIVHGLESTAAAVLLVSADFLASQYIREHEIPPIEEARRGRGLRVYWVLLSPCDLDGFVIFQQRVQAVNPALKALSELSRHGSEKVWETLTRQIKSDLSLLAGSSASTDLARSRRAVSNRAGRKVPPLLHYHCDRMEQEAQLDQALRSPSSSGPLVFLAHGDERQCHDKFLERVARKSLPEILDPNGEHPAAKEFRVELPGCERPDEFRPRLLRYLGLTVLKKSTATTDELDAAFAALGRPVIVSARLNTREWVGGRRAAIQLFLDFWGDWPERPARFRPVVFLVVIYQRGPSRGLFGWYWRLCMRRANRRFREHLNAIASRTEGRTPALVLDELRGMEQSDLENWANDETLRRFLGGRDLLNEVRALWNCPGLRDADDRIPMEVVARELKRLLDPESANSVGTLS
jgi:hypothetical protein